jgi:hypothetical protein
VLFFARAGGRVTTQFVPALLDPLPTATEEPDPPGDTVVLPDTPLRPVVTVVVFEPLPCPVRLGKVARL